jgi:hypothetical protein
MAVREPARSSEPWALIVLFHLSTVIATHTHLPEFQSKIALISPTEGIIPDTESLPPIKSMNR